jgi:hypothetical protein
MMHDKSFLPKEYQNKLLTFNKNSCKIKKHLKKKEIWIHVDEKIKLKEVLNILEEVRKQGYKIFFTSKQTLKNNEQIITFKKAIVNINKKQKRFEINTC